MRQPLTTRTNNQNTLYSVVFECVYVKWLAWCLFMFFLVHPIVPVFAAEEPATAPTESSDASDEQVLATVPVLIDEASESEPETVPDQNETSASVEEVAEESDGSEIHEEIIEEDETAETAVEQPADKTAVVHEENTLHVSDVGDSEASSTTTASAVEVVDETATTTVAADDGEIVDLATTTDSGDSSTALDSEDAQASSGGSNADSNDVAEETDLAESESDVVTELEDEEEETASSTEVTDDTAEVRSTSTAPMVVVEHQPESDYAFSKEDCRVVGNSFYCTNPAETEVQLEDALFAAADKDGDTEIYLRVDGVEMQLTDNRYDDASPYYDAFSEKIVWHSLRNDRYQIVMYDLATEKETLITEMSYNNMQPMIYGDVIFWQAWIDDNWEIVRLEDGRIIQMTDNNVHDIAPYAQDDHVMWQTQNGDEWKISLYDLRTKKQQYLEAEGDGHTKNPRLVLMYESHDANGDVRLLGYDFKRKQHIPLHSLPASVPPRLPEPEEDTDERALVQSKPTVREETSEDESDGTPIDGLDLTAGSSTHATSGNDVVITPFVSEDVEAEEEELAEAEAALDELVRQARDRGTSTDLSLRLPSDRDKIEDIVIPPNRASSTRR